MEPPETPVITPSVQVPDVEALGQRQPGAEVLGVIHRDEQDVGLDVLGPDLREGREEFWITGRLEARVEDVGLAKIKLQLFLVRV